MTHQIKLTNVDLDYFVYSLRSQSLRSAVFNLAVGGKMYKAAGDVAAVKALHDINLEINEGDRIALVGHNGSGKTTLLRALSGAYEPDEGSIEVHGRIASLLDLSLGIDPSATGYENIRLRCRIGGLSSKEIDARIDEIAEFTGLGPFLSMPVKTYSAGMQGRLAFAAATAVECDVLLMDEWIAVGDADFQKIAHKRLLKLVERAGILVLATHEAPLLRLYCNKVMKLEGGVASEIVDIRKLDQLLAS